MSKIVRNIPDGLEASYADIKLDTIADLVNLTGTPPDIVWVSGYHTKGDGSYGSHIFEWDAASTEPHNGGTIIELGAPFPTDWSDSAQLDNWYSYSGGTTGRYKLRSNYYIDVKWFGAKGDWDGTSGTNDTSALQNSINYCRENNRALFVSAGKYLVSPGISVPNNSTNMYNFIMFGETNGSGRHYSYPSVIVFDDDGTSTGLIGMEISVSPILKSLMFTTKAGDTRSATGDFIGIQTVGSSVTMDNCTFESCSGTALKASDLGYSIFSHCIFRYNGEGLKSYLINWSAATTCTFFECYAFQNNVAFQADGITNSIWENCIMEYNGIGIANISIKNTLKNNYFEQNGTYGVYAPDAASALLLDNFSHSSGDSIYISGSTGSFGFDSIGATDVVGSFIRSRAIEFYDRSGGNSKRIKCSNASYSGELILEQNDGTVDGIIPTILSSQSSGYATKMYNFLLKGTTALGVPTGFTVDYVSTGRWSIDWDDSVLLTSHRWPYVQIQGLKAAGGSYVPVVAMVYPKDSSGVWNSYNNMNLGFDAYIYTVDTTSGTYTLSDQAAMVQVTI